MVWVEFCFGFFEPFVEKVLNFFLSIHVWRYLFNGAYLKVLRLLKRADNWVVVCKRDCQALDVDITLTIIIIYFNCHLR